MSDNLCRVRAASGGVLPRLGMSGYARVLAAMPGTSDDLVKKLGINRNSVARLAREFHALGIVHRADVVQGPPRSSNMPRWAFGPGVDAPTPRPASKAAPRAASIAFASVIKALQKPHSRAEIAAETGLSLQAVGKIIGELRAVGLCRIGAWERRHGCPIPWHVIGPGKDQPRPLAKTRKEINAAQNAATTQRRRMLRVLHGLAGQSAPEIRWREIGASA